LEELLLRCGDDPPVLDNGSGGERGESETGIAGEYVGGDEKVGKHDDDDGMRGNGDKEVSLLDLNSPSKFIFDVGEGDGHTDSTKPPRHLAQLQTEVATRT